MTNSEDVIYNRVAKAIDKYLGLGFSKHSSITTALIEEIAALLDKIYVIQSKVHKLENSVSRATGRC